MLNFKVICGTFIAFTCVLSLLGVALKRDAYIKAKLNMALAPLPTSSATPAPDWAANTTRTLFIGDSRIAQWPLPTPPAGYSFINRGKGGETSLHLTQRLAPILTTHRPDLVILQIGINDLVAASLAPKQAPVVMANLETHLEQIIQTIHATDAQLILLTITQPARPSFVRRNFTWSPRIHQHATQINEMILAQAAPPVVKVLDTNALFEAGSGPLDPKWALDALHHTPKAYSTLSQALLQELT